MTLIAEYVMQNVQREMRPVNRSHYLVVGGTPRADGSCTLIQTEVTECSLRDKGREAIKDAMWKLCELWVDDFCDPRYWRAAGPLLK